MSRPRALLSVSNKRGIVELGQGLVGRGWQLVSTGGTARALREAELPVTEVAEVTGHTEMMSGRVKTLHPAVHAGILARRHREDDLQALEAHGYAPIDLVAVNLYPFREAVATARTTMDGAMEQVDIGGPTMIRAAAKNHRDVWVMVDPGDYDRVLFALDQGEGEEALDLRRELAAKVFVHTGGYDAAIASHIRGEEDGHADAPQGVAPFAPRLEPLAALRYGENPDQAAAFYGWGPEPLGLAALDQLHGKELSYNNILDLDGALLALSPFAFSPRPAACIVKHTTPCGLALGETLEASFRRALATDPVSAFGSVVAVNRPLDAGTAMAISEIFVECVVAPTYSEEALGMLMAKKSIRILASPGVDQALSFEPSEGWWSDAHPALKRASRFLAAHGRLPEEASFRSVYGGALVQAPAAPPFYGNPDGSWRVVTSREPSEQEWDDLRFAWAAVFGVKSNAILLARNGATLGIGAGQMSRVDSSRIAVMKAAEAGLALEGSVLASDAFFPFRDGVDAAAEAGVSAVIQPGGSIRDEEVVDAANEHGVAMVLTGRRLFRH